MKLLHIDSSILGAHSVSRLLSAAIVAKETALHPGLDVTYRDLEAKPLMHLSGAHLAAFQGGAAGDPALGADVQVGGGLIDELFATDLLVIGLPMYNFGIPSQLKAWIDRIMVAGRTFKYGAAGPEGLVTGKKAFIASARGGVYSAGSPAVAMEHQESYLISALAFIGITDVTVVRAEGLAMGPDVKAAAAAAAQEQIAQLVA
jgi:FMN-dependent NADH-azoreductase